MGYDRIWIFQGTDAWLERRAACKRKMELDFDLEAERLYNQGHSVVLRAGRNLLFDEIFLFERAADANEFYNFGYQGWESYLDGEDEGCGFQEIARFRKGKLIRTKAAAPSAGTEAKNE
jgi:hypothetical protein